MTSEWDDDQRLLTDLGAAVRAERSMPEHFAEIGKSAFAWRTVDAELAELTFDSATAGADAGVRAEPAVLRSLTFAARGLSIELEITPDALLGQVVPPQPGELEVHRPDGTITSVEVDEVGWFTVRPRPDGRFRLRLHTGSATVLTEWASI